MLNLKYSVTLTLAAALCACASNATTDGGSDVPTGDTIVGESGSTDTPAVDSATNDTVSTDATGTDVVATDTAGTDAGPACGETMRGTCAGGLMCLECPLGPIMVHYLCTTPCTSDAQCTDASRPHCNRETMGGAAGICTTATYVCSWGARCASPNTLVATPSGDRRIEDLRAGDVVYSVVREAFVAVPLLAVHSVDAGVGHHVVRVTLESGRVVEMSPGHPTADGRVFADLREGDVLGGAAISRVETVPYAYARTYDVLPDSESGAYVASGAVVGTTLLDARAELRASAVRAGTGVSPSRRW